MVVKLLNVLEINVKQNNSNTTITQETYNNSIIQANGNNSKINIKSNNNDINIKGANIEADNDINLLAVNGNINIESNQDKYYNDTDTYGFQVGGTIGFNIGKDYQKEITNNYTTIKSNNGKTNIETNDLTLVGIQDKVKNNMNTDLVKENISETQLKEKHDSEYYDLGISYSLPLSIGNLNKKANDVMTDGINKIANTTIINDLDIEGKEKYAKIMSNYISLQQKAIQQKFDISKLMSEVLKYNGDVNSAINDTKKGVFSFDISKIKQIAANVNTPGNNTTEQYQLKR
jgi:hypothetical protein